MSTLNLSVSTLAVVVCLPGLDQPGMEPMDWSVWDTRTFEEILHRFRPKAVYRVPSISQLSFDLATLAGDANPLFGILHLV